MRFSIALIAAFAAFVQAGVFTKQTYNDISISGGVAGNAEEEALSVFSALDMNNLAAADKADLDFLNSVNQICNKAETEAFNPAIEAASGDAAKALQRGKIKNKVLKLEATIIRLKIQQAQGKNVSAQMAKELKKLNNNIKQDEDEAGQPSTALSFDASTK
ncbi:uncharacterized protein F4812DRAFT_461675 [Daldinia caldariorum]|uniref:uncharacterized protein n=1 Tax=Daldinia caldariorum TaxID=326644 RepID=UPI0020078AE2|nr:uncharacterized protein F4812DRAFT_461675 [Daldinia caldariorum]KAI1465366.1 hypothetical protein F4812DRAFT_461675 [Daldinia caldariorum]